MAHACCNAAQGTHTQAHKRLSAVVCTQMNTVLRGMEAPGPPDTQDLAVISVCFVAECICNMGPDAAAAGQGQGPLVVLVGSQNDSAECLTCPTICMRGVLWWWLMAPCKHSFTSHGMEFISLLVATTALSVLGSQPVSESGAGHRSAYPVSCTDRSMRLFGSSGSEHRRCVYLCSRHASHLYARLPMAAFHAWLIAWACWPVPGCPVLCLSNLSAHAPKDYALSAIH